MAEKAFTVSQVGNYLKYIVSEDAVLSRISVEGEISDFKISNGHAYFSLKDEESALQCVWFHAQKSFENGDKVIIKGRADYYLKTGRLSFIVSEIKRAGTGDIWQRYLELKRRMEAEGYFSQEQKKEIPRYPKRVGVVTSEKGAVIRDIINVLTRRNPTVDIVLYPSKVQGADAERELAEGIACLDRDEYKIDTIILARGGGSLEDLLPFYTESLALAVYACKTPIISAIGHETDITLTDFTADLRAPTPSAAAELVSADYNEMRSELYTQVSEIYERIQKTFEQNRVEFLNSAKTVSSCCENRIRSSYHAIKSSMNEIYLHTEKRRLSAEKEFEVLSSKVATMNPIEVLKRGYARVYKEEQEVIIADQIQQGDKVTVRMYGGKLFCSVDRLIKDAKK